MASVAAEEENENETVYFLSHYQAEGGTVARDIYYSMKEKGIKCWLDVKMQEQDEDAMREGVKLCEVVLIIMSPKYFTRPFCVKELEWAVEFGKPIVVVNDATRKNEIGNILSSCPPHLRGIGSINFISIVPGTKDLWETSIKLILKAKPKILKQDGTVVKADKKPSKEDKKKEQQELAQAMKELELEKEWQKLKEEKERLAMEQQLLEE